MKKKKNEHNRKRNRSITFRLTREEELKIRERINVLGIPMQEFFLDSFTSTEIVILWGMFANERLAIEIKRLSNVLEDALSLEDDNFDADEVLDDVRCCRICLEEIENILRQGHQLPEEQL
jgi:hypothetical protein